jgi:hypothetical protein
MVFLGYITLIFVGVSRVRKWAKEDPRSYELKLLCAESMADYNNKI